MSESLEKPRKWNEDRPRQAYELGLLGCTDKEMARVMDIDVNTLDHWKRIHPEFLEALSKGKLEADAKVAEALYKRAIGYSCEETHVALYRGEVIKTTYTKNYPPDSWACNKWLSIRQRQTWADIHRVETTQTNININKLDLTGISTEDLQVLERIQIKQLSQHSGGN